MIYSQLHQVAFLPTGKIRQQNPLTGVFELRVYQRVHPNLGNRGRRGEVGLQERTHVIPFDPKTTAQVVQRDKMRSAVVAWSALVEPEKKAYRKLAEHSGSTGYQYFIGLHMRGFF